MQRVKITTCSLCWSWNYALSLWWQRCTDAHLLLKVLLVNFSTHYRLCLSQGEACFTFLCIEPQCRGILWYWWQTHIFLTKPHTHNEWCVLHVDHITNQNMFCLIYETRSSPRLGSQSDKTRIVIHLHRCEISSTTHHTDFSAWRGEEEPRNQSQRNDTLVWG